MFSCQHGCTCGGQRLRRPAVLSVSCRRLTLDAAWQVRKNGTVKWLRPDGKTQVTVEYRKEGGAVIPLRVHTILISTQHDEDVTNEQIHKDLMEHVIKPVSGPGPTPAVARPKRNWEHSSRCVCVMGFANTADAVHILLRAMLCVP